MRYKADIRNRKYPTGMMLRVTRDYIVPGCSGSNMKQGQYVQIIDFGPGVFQPPTGRHSYVFQRCSKTGKLFKWSNGWDQTALEMDLAGGLFEVVQ